ncbi:hypothetical protein AN643_03120 [Candidatus Epulonipiscioides saccharophilum]|nr:hypothetical protein AN643_03120 [Epulopiscium sp. SCG-B10WGA-EpuloB]
MDNQKHNIILLLGVIFTIIFTIFATMRHNFIITDELQKLSVNTLNEITLKQQSELNETVDSNMELINLLSISLASANENVDQFIIPEYASIFQSISSMNNIYIIDNNGHGTLLNTNEPYTVDEQTLQKVKNTLENEYYISTPIMSEVLNEEVLLLIAPIITNQNIEGYVVGEYNIAKFIKKFSISFENGHILIVDNSGDIIIENMPKNDRSAENLLEVLEDPDLTNEVLRNIMDRKPMSILTTIDQIALEKNIKVGQLHPLDFNEWFLLNIVPERTINNFTYDIMNETNILTSSIVLFLILLVIMSCLKQKNTYDAIHMLAYYDELTGLPNLVKFKIEAVRLLSSNKDKEFSIIKLDILNFKAINELYGYETGNEVLRALAEVVHNQDVENYFCAKVDVDEFLLLGPSEIFEELKDDPNLNSNKFKEAVSIIPSHDIKILYGRYIIEREDIDIAKIIANVNIAHQKAKATKNLYFCDYDEKFKKNMLKATSITNKMKTALENKEFKVVLQPKYNTITEKAIGAEALVRWIEDDGHVFFPDEFIPLFENNGFITRLDKYMLSEVCKLINAWTDAGITPLPVSVNFSRIHLDNPNFPQEINNILATYNVDPQYIEVEITESTILENELRFINMLKSFKDSDIEVAIDDFGYGYSSLGFLKDFDVSIIKLDKSFFSLDVNNRKSHIVIENIINMLKQLSITVVVEGVETKEQLDFLKSTDCDIVQGYYFSKPIPIKDFNKNILGLDI